MHERVKIHLTYMQKKRKWREKISFDYFNSFYQIHHFILSELIQIFQFYLNKIDKNLNYLHIKILTIFYSEIHKMQRNKLNKPFFFDFIFTHNIDNFIYLFQFIQSFIFPAYFIICCFKFKRIWL